MLCVDRDKFIAWVAGRFWTEGTSASDDEKSERAEEAMLRGETIGLTVAGVLVTTMAYDPVRDGYIEERILPECKDGVEASN